MINVDVLINGGGMVGASIALALLEKTPWQIALLERNPPQAEYDLLDAPDLRVSALNLASCDWLKKYGSWQEIMNTRVHAYDQLSVWEDLSAASLLKQTSPNATHFYAKEINQTHLGYFVENRLTQWGIWQKLLVHIRSGRCILPFNDSSQNMPFNGSYVTDLMSNDSQKVDLLITNTDNTQSQLIRAKLAVAADGANSHLRDMAGIERSQSEYTQQAFAIGVELDEPSGSQTWQAFKPEGPVALLPMMSIENRHYAVLIWYADSHDVRELKQLSYDALKQEIIHVYPNTLPEIKQVYATSSFALAKTHAKHYSQNRIVLAGDAAHTINPLAGQGVNIGFKDAKELSSTLIELAKTPAQLSSIPALNQALRFYERTRRKENYLMMNSMDLFYYGFSNNNLPLKQARNIALAAAQRSGVLKQKVLAHAVGY